MSARARRATVDVPSTTPASPVPSPPRACPRRTLRGGGKPGERQSRVVYRARTAAASHSPDRSPATIAVDQLVATVRRSARRHFRGRGLPRARWPPPLRTARRQTPRYCHMIPRTAAASCRCCRGGLVQRARLGAVTASRTRGVGSGSATVARRLPGGPAVAHRCASPSRAMCWRCRASMRRRRPARALHRHRSPAPGHRTRHRRTCRTWPPEQLPRPCRTGRLARSESCLGRALARSNRPCRAPPKWPFRGRRLPRPPDPAVALPGLPVTLGDATRFVRPALPVDKLA